jgi:LacI family transcriptional regulator
MTKKISIKTQAAVQEMPLRPDGIIDSSGGVSGTGGALLALIAGLADACLTTGREVDIVTKQLFKRLPYSGNSTTWCMRTCAKREGKLTKALIGAIEGKPVTQLQTLAVPTEVTWQIPDAPDDPRWSGKEYPASVVA